MRQAGFLAAAGIYAMDNHIDRLADDHKKAAEIGEVLSKFSFIKKVEPIETNIIIFELDESQMSSQDFLKKLEENQISIIGMGQGKLRIVTHLDYTDAMHDHFLAILKKIG
jgi:threonine aldolase